MNNITRNMDTIDEETIRRESSNTETGNSNQRFKKCIRKGDIVCFTNEENIHMANKAASHEPTKTILDSQKSMERISSGESLYKTFTFAQSLNDEDTEKCIAFWKSVMEKNLEPVKCNIIENRAYQNEENADEETCESVKVVEPETKMEEVNIEEQIDEKLKLVHKEYRDMWDRAIKQMQKTKLDKIKLARRARCKMCETLDAPFKEDVCADQATIDKEIKDLNKWKSTARKKAYATGFSSGPKVKQDKPKQKPSSKLQKSKDIHATDPNATEGTELQEILEETPKKIKPPPDTNTYEFVDAIEIKRKSGKYCEWRSNTVQETCNCGYKICCCNTNPAVKGIIPSTFVPSIPVVIIDKTTKKADTRQSADKQVATVKPPTKSSLSMKSEDLSIPKGSVKKALSLLIQCECSTESCDCKGELEILSRTKLPEEQWEIPKPPEIHPLLQKRSSLEIYKEKISMTDVNLVRSISDHAVDRRYEQDEKYPDAVDPEDLSTDGNSNIHPPSVDNDEHTNTMIDIPEIKSNLSIKKTLSLLIQGCGCKREDCDCIIVEEMTRENLPSEVYKSPDIVPNVAVKPMKQLRDSLELARSKTSLEQKQSDVSPIPPAQKDASAEEIYHKPILLVDSIPPYEPENLQVTESKIIVRKDSLQLTHERSDMNWTTARKQSTLEKDKQCYEQIDDTTQDMCGRRGRHLSISSGAARPNVNKLLKKISFSAKNCRCTNSRCDCYNVLPPEFQALRNNDKQEDKSVGMISDFEDEIGPSGSISRNVSKERVLGYDSESMKVILPAMQREERKPALVDEVTSLAASQFLDFNNM